MVHQGRCPSLKFGFRPTHCIQRSKVVAMRQGPLWVLAQCISASSKQDKDKEEEAEEEEDEQDEACHIVGAWLILAMAMPQYSVIGSLGPYCDPLNWDPHVCPLNTIPRPGTQTSKLTNGKWRIHTSTPEIFSTLRSRYVIWHQVWWNVPRAIPVLTRILHVLLRNVLPELHRRTA